MNGSLPPGQRQQTIVIAMFMSMLKSLQAETTVKLIILELLAKFFGWMWIGASMVSVYFLYGALASAAPWSDLLWSIGAGLIAKYLAVVSNRNKQRVDYVDQLMARSYTQADANEAWKIMVNGGSNLFGSSVSANKHHLVVGDSLYSGDFVHQGAVVIYALPHGTRRQRIVSNEPQDSGFFGSSVDIRGGQIAVGEPWGLDTPGSAYIFRYRNTALQATEY